eukprot:gene5323-33708_t
MLANSLLGADLIEKEETEKVLERYAVVPSSFPSPMATIFPPPSPSLLTSPPPAFTRILRPFLPLRRARLPFASHPFPPSPPSPSPRLVPCRDGQNDQADFTNAFRSLSSVKAGRFQHQHCLSVKADDSDINSLPEQLVAALAGTENTPSGLTVEREASWLAWLGAYRVKLREEGMEEGKRTAMQDSVNPKFVPRQHLLQYAIEDAEKGDMTEVNR